MCELWGEGNEREREKQDIYADVGNVGLFALNFRGMVPPSGYGSGPGRNWAGFGPSSF